MGGKSSGGSGRDTCCSGSDGGSSNDNMRLCAITFTQSCVMKGEPPVKSSVLVLL